MENNMRTIHKISLPISLQDRDIFVPKGANWLTAQIQQDQFVIWYECNSEDANESRRVLVTWTGHSLPNYDDFGLWHIGTIQDQVGLVWHIFEVIKREISIDNDPGFKKPVSWNLL